MPSNKTYRLYPKAIDDLESIYFYSLREFGSNKADDYIREIEHSFQRITNNPEIAQKCDDIKVHLKAINVGSYVYLLLNKPKQKPKINKPIFIKTSRKASSFSAQKIKNLNRFISTCALK